MIYLKYSTAGQEVPLGHFVDSTNGDDEETGLTIANTDIKLWKFGATTLANKNSGGATHISNGVYYCTLDDTDTNTLGSMVIFVHVSGALTVRLECCVLPTNIYDSWIAGTDYQDVNTAQVEGSDATDQIRDSVVDDSTRIDASALNTLSGHDPGSQIAAQTDVTGLNDLSSADVQSACDSAITANTDINNIDTGVNNIEAKLPSKSYLTGSNNTDGDIQMDEATGNYAGTVATVTTVGTCTTNSDMRGTDNAALASVCTEGRLSELDAGNLPADIAGLNDISSGDVTTACTSSLNSYDPPTKTEMDNAFAALNDPAIADIVAGILAGVLPDLTDGQIDSGQSITIAKALRANFNRFYREVTQTASLQTVKNDSDAAIADMAVSDDGTTQTKGST